jgi:hypothetical protein
LQRLSGFCGGIVAVLLPHELQIVSDLGVKKVFGFDNARRVSISPDCSLIAVLDKSGLSVLTASGERVAELEGVRDAVWSDNKSLAVAGGESGAFYEVLF